MPDCRTASEFLSFADRPVALVASEETFDPPEADEGDRVVANRARGVLEGLGDE